MKKKESESKKIRREVIKEILFPWEDGDPKLSEMIKNVHDLRKQIKSLEGQIDALKGKLKPLKEEYEKLQDSIASGVPRGVIVFEIIDFDNNIIHSTIKETNEELPDRPIGEKDRENNIGDEEV